MDLQAEESIRINCLDRHLFRTDPHNSQVYIYKAVVQHKFLHVDKLGCKYHWNRKDLCTQGHNNMTRVLCKIRHFHMLVNIWVFGIQYRCIPAYRCTCMEQYRTHHSNIKDCTRVWSMIRIVFSILCSTLPDV